MKNKDNGNEKSLKKWEDQHEPKKMKEQLADFIKAVLKAPVGIWLPVSDAMLDFVRALYEEENLLSPTEYGFYVIG